LVIRDQAGLSRLIGYKGRVHLDLPHLAKAQQDLAEARLNRALLACGCTEGAFGLIVALLPAGVLAWRGQFGWAFGMVLLGALAGKLVGLARRQAALRREIRALFGEIADDQ
jgi:hypothetical protein